VFARKLPTFQRNLMHLLL